MNINDEIKRLTTEIANTEKAIENVKDHIRAYDLKGKELTEHYNYTKGALDILVDLRDSMDSEVSHG